MTNLNGLVTNRLLNFAEVNSCHDRPTSDGVAETVPR
jgi:hypothetical protein